MSHIATEAPIARKALEALGGDPPLGRARAGACLVEAVAVRLSAGASPAAVLERFDGSRAAAIEHLLPLARSLCREHLHNLAAAARPVGLDGAVAPLLGIGWEDRLAALAVEGAIVHAAAPPLLADPGACERLADLLAADSLPVAVLFDQPLGITHELYPLWTDAFVHAESTGHAATRLIGVDADWLDEAGRATRAVAYDNDADIFLEADTPVPVPLAAALLLAQSPVTHRRLSARLDELGVPHLNRYAGAAEVADDKWACWQRWHETGIDTPPTCLLARDAGAAAAQLRAREFIGALDGHRDDWILQPRRSTEGRGVNCLSDSDIRAGHELTRCWQAITAAGDDAILRPWVGGTLGGDLAGRAFDLRLYVAAGEAGLAAESGFLVVAADGSTLATLAAGAAVVPVAALRDGELDGVPFGDADMAAARGAAAGAVDALGLSLAGVDLRLWRSADGLRVQVLDVNPRPAGLVHADFLTEDGTAGVSRGLWLHLQSRIGAGQPTLSAD